MWGNFSLQKKYDLVEIVKHKCGVYILILQKLLLDLICFHLFLNVNHQRSTQFLLL